MARDKLDNKLAGGMSPEMQKGLRTVAKIHDMLGDLRKRCDDVRKQMEEIEREDLVAQQKSWLSKDFSKALPSTAPTTTA